MGDTNKAVPGQKKTRRARILPTPTKIVNGKVVNRKPVK